jgi:exodeoxyribonuclease V alpha subunit
MGDKVMQLKNSYDKGVFNGDMGLIVQINSEDNTLVVDFEGNWVTYESTEIDQIIHSYCVSIHKSQGSEFPVSVVVLHTTHYMMLQRNLVYTAITRAKNLAIVIGSKSAFYRAVQNNRSVRRYTGLQERLKEAVQAAGHAKVN